MYSISFRFYGSFPDLPAFCFAFFVIALNLNELKSDISVDTSKLGD